MKALLVALQEVRIYLQDKADLAFSLLLPIAIFALMYGAFSGQSMFHGTAYVVNQDEGKTYSRDFIKRLKKLDNLDVELLSASEADSKLESSDLLMVVFIPEDFSDELESEGQASLVFKQRGNAGQENQIVASLVRGVAEEMNQEFAVQDQVKNAVKGKKISITEAKLATRKFLGREKDNPLIQVKEEEIGIKPDPVKLFLPGIITMFVLFAITLNARVIVEERKRGTLERLLTTRLRISQLFIGKFLAGTLRGFVQALILLILGYIVFQLFTPLSFIEVLVIALVFAAAASAVGLLIASVSRTEDQTVWMGTLFTMAMAMVGGTFFEIPKDSALYSISRASMNTYANDALKMIMVKGGSLLDVGTELAVLVGVAVVALVLSRFFFKIIPGGA